MCEHYDVLYFEKRKANLFVVVHIDWTCSFGFLRPFPCTSFFVLDHCTDFIQQTTLAYF